MIRFSLRCRNGHAFESWFASGSAFDTLRSAGHLRCPVCDSAEVDKALMAPAVATAAPQQNDPAPDVSAEQPMATPTTELEARLKALRAHIESTSDYVGRDFAREARRMHLGEAPERPIHGEARIDEARALIEDGVPVAPLPFRPSRRNN